MVSRHTDNARHHHLSCRRLLSTRLPLALDPALDPALDSFRLYTLYELKCISILLAVLSASRCHGYYLDGKLIQAAYGYIRLAVTGRNSA